VLGHAASEHAATGHAAWEHAVAGHAAAGHPAAGHAGRRSRSVLTIGLEVILISAGVFLGLMGEQWRERAQHRELAHEALLRFRTELRANRESVAAVKDKHIVKLKNLQAFFATDPRTAKTLPIPDTGLAPAFMEHSAWDLALATQSLTYIDSDLAFAIAHVYAVQEQLDELTRAITQSMYAISSTESFLNGVATYFGDCTLIEPRLLKIYDEILPRLDRALGDSAAAP